MHSPQQPNGNSPPMSLLDRARREVIRANYRSAFTLYIELLDAVPSEEERASRYDEFIYCFDRCLDEDAISDEDLLRVLPHVLHFYPDCYNTNLLYARMVAQRADNSSTLESLPLYERALTLTRSANERVEIVVELENVRSHLFDQWHWPMINDGRRNGAFARAIRWLVERMARDSSTPLHVVDLGCGSGILATLVARELEQGPNPCIVSAIDSNAAMIRVAERVFELNRVRVDAYALHSAQFQHSHRISLIVSETLDCALFGERFVSSLVDLHARLGDPRDFHVLPSRARLFLALCECASLEREHFMERASNILLSHECYVNRTVGVAINDPYDSAHLDELAGGYRLLSEPREAFAVDFNDIAYLRDTLLANRLREMVTLRVRESGRANCVVGWFRLHLTNDDDDQNFIETGPGQGSCWPQALFPFYPPMHLSVGTTLDLDVEVFQERLYVSPLDLPPPSAAQKLHRMSAETNLGAMNSPLVAQFFHESIEKTRAERVIDLTDLLIPHADGVDFRRVAMSEEMQALGEELAFCRLGDGLEFQPTARTLLLHYPLNRLGQLDKTRIKNTSQLYSYARHRLNTVELTPSEFQLRGMLIHSAALQKRSSLVSADARNETYCGVDVSPMADFRVRHFHEIDVRTLDFRRVSDSATLFHGSFTAQSNDDEEASTRQNDVQLKLLDPTDSAANALLYWIELDGKSENNAPVLDVREIDSTASALLFGSTLRLDGRESVRVRTSLLDWQFHFDLSDLGI